MLHQMPTSLPPGPTQHQLSVIKPLSLTCYQLLLLSYHSWTPCHWTIQVVLNFISMFLQTGMGSPLSIMINWHTHTTSICTMMLLLLLSMAVDGLQQNSRKWVPSCFLCAIWGCKSILIYSDNLAVIDIINKGCYNAPSIMQLTYHLIWLYIAHLRGLCTAHVPAHFNAIAYCLSHLSFQKLKSLAPFCRYPHRFLRILPWHQICKSCPNTNDHWFPELHHW